MASLFDSFRNSSIPKRLLRHALARLDVLDADALNLDNLDLAWGMKTVLEFRDVGLKLDKLHHLLQLPPNFHIRRARVSLLRVTLPVDIYSSPIQIQVTGVEVRLKIAKADGDAGRRRPSVVDPDADADAVPSAQDLAQSFLAQQPSSETQALADALAHDDAHLAASAYGDDNSDEDDGASSVSSSSVLGTGQALTLPAFLAGFLQGIVDRTQLTIEGVAFQLEVDVPVDTGAADAVAAAAGSASPESVTFELALARVNVEGVTTTTTAAAAAATATAATTTTTTATPEQDKADEPPPILPKEGKRHISLEQVRACLISEANVFSTLARSPSMPSSQASQSPSIPSGRPPRHPASASPSLHRGSGSSDDGGDDDDDDSVSGRRVMDQSMAAASSVASSAMLQSQYDAALRDSEDAFNIPYDLESGSDENEPPTARGGETTGLFDDAAAFEPTAYAASAAPASPMSTPRASVYGDVAEPLATEGPSGLGLVSANDRAAGGSEHSSSSGSAEDGKRPAEEADSPGADSLAQSHVFSHEEAESMYMSAFSQAPSVHAQSAMPGGWNDDDEPTASAEPNDAAIPVRSTGAAPGARGTPPFASSVGFDNLGLSTHLPLRPAALDDAEDETPDAAPVASVRAQSPAAADRLAEKDDQGSGDASAHASTLPDRTADSELPGSPPDEAATPRGPARLVKEILALKYISIYIPSNHEQPIDIPVEPAAPEPHAGRHHHRTRHENLARSVAPHLPGAFSVYSTAGASSVAGDPSLRASQLEDSSPFPFRQPDTVPHDHEAHSADDHAVDITLAPLEIRFDASIGFLLAMVVSELLRSVKAGLNMKQQQQSQRQRGRAAASAPGDAAAAKATLPAINFHAEKISLLFLEKLAGVADTAERFLGPPGAPAFHQSDDVLLQTVLEDLVASVAPPPPSSTSSPDAAAGAASVTKTSIKLKRFRFGYADADIVSFDQRRPMLASVRDAFPPDGDDVSVRIAQSTQVTKCEISTLPLHISVDLQRLDETFSWFGGLSSFLSMGSSSMSSVASQAGGFGGLPSTQLSPKKPQTRGVRFDAPPAAGAEGDAAGSENKLDMRIGGVHLDLIGKDCRVGLDTSAVKLVSRKEIIGVAVTRIWAKGPYLHSSAARSDPPVTVKVDSTRLEFLNVPEDKDLERLLELATPSRVVFDENETVIMVETLLKQRRNGPLLRLHVDKLQVDAHNLAQLACLPALGEEIARLGTVAKYLPEDDRPGLLTLGLVRQLEGSVDLGGRLGTVQAALSDLETAHISLPALLSAAVGALSVHRNESEELIGSSAVPAPGPAAAAAAGTAPPATTSGGGSSPALMLRIIGNDMEQPVIKVKMWGLNFEYRVPTIMDVLGLSADATPQDFEASLAASVANLGEQAHTAIAGSLGRGGGGGGGGSGAAPASAGSKGKSRAAATATGAAGSHGTNPTKVDVSFHDCVVGLNPLGLSSKLNVVLVDARLVVNLPQKDEKVHAEAHLNKMNLLLVDDVSTIDLPAVAARKNTKDAAAPTAGVSFALPSAAGKRRLPEAGRDMVARLCEGGFVDVCQISAAKVSVHVSEADEDGQKTVDLEVRDDLLVLETCADSTQTLIMLANALKPPTPPSKEIKFKTQVMPMKDLLASISIDAFGRAEGNYNIDEDFILEEGEYDDGGGGYEDEYGGEGGFGLSAPASGDSNGGDDHEHRDDHEDDHDLYGAGSGDSHLVLTDQGNRAAEQSVASLPSLSAEDHDLLLDAMDDADDDDDLDADGDDGGNRDRDGGMVGTVAEKLFSASSVFSDETQTHGGADRGHGGGPAAAPIAAAATVHSGHSSGLLGDDEDETLLRLPPHGRGGPSAGSPLGSSVVSELGVEENFFGTALDAAAEEASHAKQWSSAQNGYDRVSKRGRAAVSGGGGGGGGSSSGNSNKPPPLRVRVRDVHIIWNLFDGYDWQRTRDVIAKTVEEVEAKAYERRTRHRRRSGHDQYNPYSGYADEEEEETVIGDFLFNSIYIGIPATHDPRELAQAINQEIYGADGTDTESVAATTVTAATSRDAHAHAQGHAHPHTHAQTRAHGRGFRGPRAKRLRLQRSRRHKITFELGGVGADVVVYPAGSGETQSSMDVRVRDLDVFDHVPTSTWKKFATYDRDAGERPIDGNMVHAEVLVVKPVAALAATELVLHVGVLPVRLHVDQDALDFITRFFEFRDAAGPPGPAAGPGAGTGSASDVPFIQRAEIQDIQVQLDFKPKRVDYAGLRSGHTTEFMNFLILDGSRMTLRHTIIYGVSGFERLGQTLNDIWMPDIKRHQLPGILAGLAPVRSLVTVGSGFRDLIEIPIQEYRHNGRIVRSISKGAMAFAKSTGTELVKLGAKVATGTQYVLQGAEGLMLGGGGEGGAAAGDSSGGSGGGHERTSGGGIGIGHDTTGGGADDSDDEGRKQISLYADQPTDVVQGLRHAYSSLARDLHMARDAIIAVPAEVRETTSATGAAQVVLRHAPTIVFRPAIGATKAIGQTLLGATNSLDPENLRRAEDKYKPGLGRRR